MNNKTYIKKALVIAEELKKYCEGDDRMFMNTRSKAMQLIGYVQAMEAELVESAPSDNLETSLDKRSK